MKLRSITCRSTTSLARYSLGLAATLVIVHSHIGPLNGAEIVIADGLTVEGEIISANKHAITVRRSIGGIKQIEIDSIEEVRVTTSDGGSVSGAFSTWENGNYGLIADGYLVMVSDDGRILRATTIPQATPAETAPKSAVVPEKPQQVSGPRQPTM